MLQFRALRHLTICKIGLFGVSLFMVWFIRLGLWFLPFRALRSLLSRVKSRCLPHSARVPPERVARAVEVASRLVPRATCLTKALAADALLRRSGYEGVLHIGVAHDGAGKLKAHAWLECQGKVIIGDGPGDLAPLPPIRMGRR